MAVVTISDSILTDIADAIRSKNGTENTYKPAQMPDAIEAISGGGITPTGTKQISITQNGTTTEDVTNYANAEIAVNVSGGGNNGLSFDLKSSWVDENEGYIGFLAAGTGYRSVTITNDGTVIDANNGALALRGVDLSNRTVEVKCGTLASTVSSGHQRLVCFNEDASAGLILQNSSTWKFYTGSAWVGSYGTDKNQYSNKTLKFVFGTSTLDFYVDDALLASNIAMTGRNCVFLGSTTTAFTQAIFESVTIKNNQQNAGC